VRLHVEASGPPDGPAVVFLHGVSGSGETYGFLPAEILDGWRVYGIDLRGHGCSEHATGSYTLQHYAEDVAEVLRAQVGRPAMLVGHSLGGVVAWWLAQNRPELVVRLARTHPEVAVVRVEGAPHGIHDSRAYRDVYVEHLAPFLVAHAR
jgi:lipase